MRDDPQTADKKLSGSGHPTIPPLTIDTNGVMKVLHNLNPRKASGPDEVPARLLQSLAAEVAPALTLIFEQSIQSGKLPSQWKKAWITRVFKKGARSEPANYRPVSLTSIACKMLSSLFTVRTCIVTLTLITYSEKLTTDSGQSTLLRLSCW